MAPTPQIQAPGFPGERKAEIWISPMPFVLPWPGVNAGREMMGRMVRVMMFQSSLIGEGITGWMLSTFCAAVEGPILKYAFSWSGTLMRFRHGILRDLRQIFSAQFGMSGGGDQRSH